MKSFDGYLKKKLGDAYVLLAGGGQKLLSDLLPTAEVNATQNNITWIQSYVANNPRAFVYNISGTEYSYLIGLRNNSGNGAILKMGYGDTYLRILRVVNSTWQSTDWEKMSAGYADNSGQLEGHSASYFSIAGHTHTFGDVSGCPLWITGSSDRKLYLKDTDGEKYSLISFLDKDGVEYGYFGVLGDSTLRWNSNTIWHSGNDGHTTGLDADLLDGLHGSYYATSSHNHNGIYLDYGGDARDIGSDAPIANAKTYVSTTNLPNAFKILYDSSGYENTLLYTFRPGSITANSSGTGTILKWGAWSTYMYIARNTGNNWLTGNSWEKISAGYADSAGDASTLGGTSKGGLFTDFSRPSNTNNLSMTIGGTTKAVTLGSLAFDSTSYLPLTGGTMTGASPITFTNSKVGLAFPGDGPSFEARIMFQSESYESLTFAQKNTNSSFIFATGLDLANGTNWSTHAPTLHIKNKSVYINTNIGTGNSVPAYTFYVNGGAGFSGGVDMGCPLTISGGCDRKLYFKDTDGEKWSQISFLDSNGNEYGLLGVHGDSNLCWNTRIIYHTGNLPAYPTKNSWNYDDRYVTDVGAGGSGHTNEIYYTKNGSNTYFTVPYSSNSGALEGNSLNNIIKRNGSRNCVSMKPATIGARTSISGFTIVTHPKTSLGDTYYFLRATTDIPTGKYLFSVRASGFSGSDHWVFYFLNSGAYGGIDCRNGWSSAVINMPASISAGSNILIDDSNSGTAANSDTVVFSEWMLTPIDEGTYTPAPEDLVHLYGGLTISGNLTATNFYTTSDRNKKQNISSFSEHIRKFQLKDTEKWHYGVIAQEVPEMFRDGEEGNMTVNYNSVLSYYIGQLENKVKDLEEKVRQLENLNK